MVPKGKGANKNLYATDEDESEHIGETPHNVEGLQACLLEESENEQWREVISRRDKLKTKHTNHAS